jgi:hypothetical protein
MVEIFGAIIDHGHDVGVIMLVVIVKGVKEYAQADPLVAGAKHRSLQALQSTQYLGKNTGI